MNHNEIPLVDDDTVPAGVRERLARQEDALRVIGQISDQAGITLPIVSCENRDFIDEPAVYLVDDAVIERGPIANVTFAYDPKATSGAADSAHAVMAGLLDTSYESGEERSTQVAVKVYQKRPYADRLVRAHREIAIMRVMEQKGELALSPVAVAITPATAESDASVVLITRLRESLYTFDNHAWLRGQTDENIEKAGLVAKTLGRFNSYGLCHGDAKIKNFASVPNAPDATGGGVSMIDFETTTSFDVTNPAEVASTAYLDFGLLLKSLDDKGLFTPSTKKVTRYGYSYTTPDRVSDVIDAMVDGYLSNWVDASPEVQTAVYEGILSAISSVGESHQDVPIAV